MNNTFKIVFSVIGLLVIGFLGGYQTHRTMVKRHMKRVAKERISPGFVERMVDVLDIREGQAGEVKPILENYSGQLIESRKAELERRRPILDSMRLELAEVLDAPQQEKLDHVIERMKRSKRHDRRDRRTHTHKKER